MDRMNAATSPEIGLILVDHGSRLAAANEQLDAVAALYRQISGRRIVEPAHMELAAPTIAQAFDACVRQGAKLVVVHPYFLAPGRHSTTDIPRLTAQAAQNHPDVRYHVTAPLGLDEKITQVIEKRILECAQAGYTCDYCHLRTACQKP